MKVLVTGAHFTPAQAVIEEFLENYPDVEIMYIGRRTTIEGDPTPSIESQVLPKLGVKFLPLIAGRFRKILSFYTVISLLKIPIGFLQSLYYLIKEKPDVVLSFGGYVGLPVSINAWLLNIPVIVHEQTLVTGLANSVANFFADKIATSFDKKYSFDNKKIIFTGNPLRKDLLTKSKHPSKKISSFIKDRNLKVIYITGGNQGSHIINTTAKDLMPELTDSYKVIHQTGDSKFNDFEQLNKIRDVLRNKNKRSFSANNYLVQKWFDAEDVGLIFRNTDLVISRAGANTLTELSFFGVPTIIIPLSFSNRDEQNINAKFFKEKGLGEVILEKNLNSLTLLSHIRKILDANDKYKKSATLAKKIVVKDAAKRLAQQTYLLGVKSV